MAINKVVNKSTKSHGAMRNVIEYVLQIQKIGDGYVDITGPYSPDTITWDNVYRAFLDEKKLWNKDNGRMYAHNIISFHEDEKITPAECLEIGREFVGKFFPNHQSLIGIHQDKNHLHIHIVTNSVSFIDGLKLHQSQHELDLQKEFTNQICHKRGLTITEKGKHFDGSEIEPGEIIAWSKDKYNLLKNEGNKSYVADCAIAYLEVMENCRSKDSFISQMKEKGWTVHWSDTRKHITFENENGEKVRDSNLSKTFKLNIGKEDLKAEFKRQDENRIAKDTASDIELKRYYDEVEAAVSGRTNNPATINSDSNIENRAEHENSDDFEIKRRETTAFIRQLNLKERAAEEKRDDSIAERANRDAEQRRQNLEAEQRAREAERRIEAERAAYKRRSRDYDFAR